MDQEMLEEMARVYMTDKGCQAAVDRYMSENRLLSSELVFAAQQVARKVAPAPHNAAAHDARYLLAPDAEAVDLAALDRHIPAHVLRSVEEFEASARAEREQDAEAEENAGIGPIPPHPQETPEDRQRFSEVRTISATEYSALPSQNQFLGHDDCGPLCQLVEALTVRVGDTDRLPVRPPMLTVDRVGDDYTLALSVDTVPMRRRDAMLIVGFGDHDTLDASIAGWVERMEAYPDHRLVVRRNPAQEWCTAVVYRPVPSQEESPLHFVEVTGQRMSELMGALFGEDRGRFDVFPRGVALVTMSTSGVVPDETEENGTGP
jgi:hypothetical protein